MLQKVVLREQYGFSSVEKEYIDSTNGHIHVIDRSPRHKTVLHLFRRVFLPQGYPESVSEDYLTYQVWDTIQAFASSMSNTLAAHALLKGIGVGDENASVLAATFTWILKDGTGMIGRILFAWKQGNKLDCDAKKWRLFADFLNDCAIFLEILAPLFQAYFRFVVCIAGVGKAMVGVAGGATRAALTQHQARRNNMADVSAKDGSQETLVNLSALLLSMLLLPLVNGNYFLIWTTFLMLTTLHLFANYQAVKVVCMESLNQARLHLVLQHYLSTGEVQSVTFINAQEPLILPIKRKIRIALGVSFKSICERYRDFEELKKAYYGSSSKYLLFFNQQKGLASIVLKQQAQPIDQLKACVQAELVNFLLGNSKVLCSEIDSVITNINTGDPVDLMHGTYVATEKMMPRLLTSLAAQGWITEHFLLCADEWRADWDFSGLPDKKQY